MNNQISNSPVHTSELPQLPEGPESSKKSLSSTPLHGHTLTSNIGATSTKEKIDGSFQKIRQNLKDLGASVKDLSKVTFQNLKEKLPQAEKKIKTLTTKFWQPILTGKGREEIRSKLKEGISDIKEKVITKANPKEIPKKLQETANSALKKLGQVKSKAITEVKEKFSSSVDKLKQGAIEVKEKIADYSTQLFDNIKSLKEKFDSSEKMAKGVKQKPSQSEKSVEKKAESRVTISEESLESLDESSEEQGESIANDSQVLKSYGDLLDKISQDDGSHRLQIDGETKLIKEVKISNPGKIANSKIDKEDKLAFKEMIGKAEAQMETEPFATMEFLIKLKNTSWGNKVLKASPEGASRFKKIYQKGIDQSVAMCGAKFSKALASVTKEEILNNRKVAGKPEFKTVCPNLSKYNEFSTNLSYKVVDTVISQKNEKARVLTMETFIRMADKALKNNDHPTFEAIRAAFSMTPLYRLSETKNNLSKDTKKLLEDFDNKFGNSTEGVPEQRETWIESSNKGTSLIPSIPMAFLTPLLFAAEKMGPLKDEEKSIKLFNESIDMKLQNQDFDSHVASLEKDVKNEDQYEAAFKAQKFDDYFTLVKGELSTLGSGTSESKKGQLASKAANHKAVLKEQLANLESKLKSTAEDDPNHSSLLTETRRLRLENKFSEDLYKSIGNLLLDQPGKTQNEILNDLKNFNSERIAKYEIGINKHQSELNTITEQFESLRNHLPEISSKANETFIYEGNKDEIDTRFYNRSKEIQPQKS